MKVALRCSTCRTLHDQTLDIHDANSFDGAKIAAYWDIVDWNQQTPIPGAQLEITVVSPFCCTVGDPFWATDEERFVQAKLLSILSMDDYKASILVEVLQIKDKLDFVQPVTEEEKMRLRQQRAYDYQPPDGDTLTPQVSLEDGGILHFLSTRFNRCCDSRRDYLFGVVRFSIQTFAY